MRRLRRRATARLGRGGRLQSRRVRVQSGKHVVAERAPPRIRRRDVTGDAARRRHLPFQRAAQRIERLPQRLRDGRGRAARRVRGRASLRGGLGVFQTERVRGALGVTEVRGGARGGVTRAPRLASLLRQLLAQARRLVVPPVAQQGGLAVQARCEARLHAVLPVRASGRSVQSAALDRCALRLRRRDAPETLLEFVASAVHVLSQPLEQRRDPA